MRSIRAELLLPFVILFGAAALAVSEFMVVFEFTPPGGVPLRETTGGEEHDFSNLVLAIAAVATMLAAILSGSRPLAFATAGLGGVALLLFLILDLPDAGKLGDLSDPVRGLASVRAEPQSGFWLQAVGAVALALGGGALATLSAAQLRALPERIRARRSARTPSSGSDAPAGASSPSQAPFDQTSERDEGDADDPTRRLSRTDPSTDGHATPRRRNRLISRRR